MAMYLKESAAAAAAVAVANGEFAGNFGGVFSSQGALYHPLVTTTECYSHMVVNPEVNSGYPLLQLPSTTSMPCITTPKVNIKMSPLILNANFINFINYT